ncbi:MAG: hypothetical protein RL148_15 [Planctomycetota bacterium]|jgi:uncharacterized protein YaiL (DUF2058 family)
MNLRDQLKKAKLLSEKDARRLAHEERVDRKEKGSQQLEAEQAQRRAELEAMGEQERRQVQQRQQLVEAERARQAELDAVRAILADQARKPGPGSIKWYFQLDDGSLPWLELSAREAQEVRAGMVCVVQAGQSGAHDYRLLGTELARRVARTEPRAVVYAPRGVVV